MLYTSDITKSSERKSGAERRSAAEHGGGRKMSEHNTGMLVGIAIGAIVGILVVILLLKITKTNGKIRCEFDERQEALRGKGFKYAFFTLLGCNCIYGFLWTGFGNLPIDAGTFMILAVLIGIGVYATYCIWRDCYFSLNENRSKLMIVFAVCGGSNLVIGISNLLHGKGIENGVMNYRCINLFCGLLFVEIFIALLLRHFRNEESCEEE